MKDKATGQRVSVGKRVGNGSMITSNGVTRWWADSQIARWLTK
jgi:hypothetical protein